jgi:hypothetical protein
MAGKEIGFRESLFLCVCNTVGLNNMWHRGSVKLFLEDQNTHPGKIVTIEKRFAEVCGTDSSFDDSRLNEVIGHPLAGKFRLAVVQKPERYLAPDVIA